MTTSVATTSSSEDLLVMYQHEHECILKLELVEEDGTTETRRIKLSQIFDDERRRVSFAKLVDRISNVMGYDIDAKALKLTYQDSQDDKVTVSSSEELSDAVEQFYKEGIMRFTGNIRRDPNVWRKSGHTDSETLISKLETAVAKIGEIEVKASGRWEKIGKLLVSKLEMSSGLIELEGQRTSDEVRAGSVMEMPTLHFNPDRAAPVLSLGDLNCRVTQGSSNGKWNCVHVTECFRSGCAYLSFIIANRGIGNNIAIGISDGTDELSFSTVSRKDNDSGCYLLLSSGAVYYGSRSKPTSNTPLVEQAETIGMLVNMSNKTITFFADNQQVGPVGTDYKLTAGKYFPVVALSCSGASVAIADFPARLSGSI